ncbi:MAG: hypothetical protein ACLP2P_05335 [Desulfobaccales bacterium]
MSEDKAKRELLRDKVVDLVKEFIKTEGGITGYDLQALFGPISLYNELATAIGEIPIKLDV